MLKRISQNSKIGIIAPAFPPDAVKLHNGIEYLQKRGHQVDIGDSCTALHGYFAGTDDLRINELHRYFSDPEIDIIICARGGWGTLRFLDKLDYDLIRANPKILVGYSDITTLQLALWKMSGLPSLSGPMVAVEMGTDILPFTEEHFWNQLYNTGPEYQFTWDSKETEIWQEGQARGRLLGGCLSMVSHQLGTPYAPDFSDSVLFIEDVGEEPFKMDRYLAHLKQNGIFKRINGLILGNFLDCEDENESRKQVGIKDVLEEYFKDAPFPVVYNFPYGHGMRKVSMPIGANVFLDTSGQSLTMQNIFTIGESTL